MTSREATPGTHRFARFIAFAATALLASAAPSCAAEDFTQAIPDDPITPQEFEQGSVAVQAISLGGPDPAFDNGQPTEETDGPVAHLAPPALEPSADQIARDQEMLDTQPAATDGDTVDPARITATPEVTNDTGTAEPSPVDNYSTSSDALRACRNATGYVNGRAYTICVTTVDSKLVGMRTARAYVRMRAAARHAGVYLHIVSGFRTMAQQRYLYNLYLSGRGNLAARPGYSNHQSGIALDLNTASSGVYRWLSNHGRSFGFRRTVPSEAWHWEYRP